MRTVWWLIILLLAFGMKWGGAPAIAEDGTAMEQLQKTCQPMTNYELKQVRGKNTNIVLQDDAAVAPQLYSVQRTESIESNIQFQRNEHNHFLIPITNLHISQRNEGK